MRPDDNGFSRETRIEIWRYTFARASLVEAREAARGLIANPRLPDDLKRAIVYQIVVAYARPFTKSQVTESKRIVPLGNDIIHSEFRNLHKGSTSRCVIVSSAIKMRWRYQPLLLIG